MVFINRNVSISPPEWSDKLHERERVFFFLRVSHGSVGKTGFWAALHVDELIDIKQQIEALLAEPGPLQHKQEFTFGSISCKGKQHKTARKARS